jgi:hypothetical protein
MPRVVRERPRKTGVATLAAIVVLAIGWLAGAGSAGSAPRAEQQIRTVVSTATETAVRTVTVPSTQGHHSQRSHRRKRP